MTTSLGIDIGSTTISFALIDRDTGRELYSRTIPDDTRIQGRSYEVLYDAEKICGIVFNALNEIIDNNEYASPSAIGVTGQMHGILYVDKDGRAVSPLYSWMDTSGAEPLAQTGGVSAVDYIKQKTGADMATGWGISTLLYHTVSGTVPETAAFICTIPDYVAMRLSGKKKPLIHSSNAASLGLFDIKNYKFRTDLLEMIGLSTGLIPEVTDGTELVGYYKNIPVSVAIGDNQASFIASVRNPENTLLLNLGTGSQISFLRTGYIDLKGTGMELRPLLNGKYIQVGSGLCGGRAISILESFLRKTAELVTGEQCANAYKGIDRYLNSLLNSGSETAFEHSLNVDTRFCGTRQDPSLKGSVGQIEADYFTPEELIKGFMFGVVEELKAMYDNCSGGSTGQLSSVVATGGAIRKNRYLRGVIERVFQCKVSVPVCNEAAAYGSAMFACVSSGTAGSLDEVALNIKYEEGE